MWSVGKVVIVAGGATSIGATAARLADAGCLVVIGDLAIDTASRTAADIVTNGGTASAVAFDLAEPDSVAALFETATTIPSASTPSSP